MRRIFCGILLCLASFAQSPSFEVATIRASGQQEPIGVFTYPGGRITASNCTLKMLKAVLYALDGATGREYLNSGSVLTAAPKGELSEQFGTVYVQTADNVLWSFGFPQDKEDFGSK